MTRALNSWKIVPDRNTLHFFAFRYAGPAPEQDAATAALLGHAEASNWNCRVQRPILGPKAYKHPDLYDEEAHGEPADVRHQELK